MDRKTVNNSRGAPPNKKQINNVVKNLKKTAFGYKNMFYFRLKIMGVCGYLNSRYLTRLNQPLT
jgi:hypothetical protein